MTENLQAKRTDSTGTGDETRSRAPHALLALLTVAAALTLGYHPYAEDGGVYAAGVERQLNPALFPHYTEFVTEHTRFSLFAPTMAALTRALHVGLPCTLLLVYLLSLWLLLYAAWQVAARCFANPNDAWARGAAVTLTAAWCGLPIAGTSLMLMDPYVTARSLTTPLALLTLAAAMDWPVQRGRAVLRICLWLAVAASLHPLMAAYTAIAALVVALISEPRYRRWVPSALFTGSFLAAGLLQMTAPRESAAETAVAITRYYWFLSEWHWYELAGLAGPLIILVLVMRYGLRRRDGRDLAVAALWMGAAAALVAMVFARANAASHLVARLQPLRIFQLVYLIMLILLGGMAGECWLRKRPLWSLGVFVVAAGALFAGQRQYYPASTHLELPWRTPRNGWVQAFEWARANTPVDALFALDAHYITTDGEDAQCFRAIAQRSALPDYSKDGGEASITPELIPAWIIGQSAQTDLSLENDAQRNERLLPLGVSWMILKRGAETSFSCPYENNTVKVCRLH